jgi:neutral ceramidase
MRARVRLGLLSVVGATLLATLALAAPASAAPGLEVGVGRADITPPTGYFMMGWVRSDGKVIGQHTRLWARTVVIKSGDEKVALVSEDLNAIAGGVVEDALALLKDRGFDETNVLVSASHTHAAPTGFYNFTTFNTVFMSLNSPTDFSLTGDRDPVLYQFMVRQLARSIARADDDLSPGKVGWGTTQLTGLTENRSIEAHLADHGIDVPFGQGSASMDPNGYAETIDPEVDVLRVDKELHGRDVPVGMWSSFANHGTVNGFQFNFYNEDHHGAATLLTEAKVRKLGHVPKSQDVVTVYGNSNEGDQSAGLHTRGPAMAEHVGEVEAKSFMKAWRQAGRKMSGDPDLDHRWTRMCFCGQDTAAGPVDDQAKFGLPQLTGSEEGRGPLYDITRQPFEGDKSIDTGDPQGDKIVTLSVDVAKAVPLSTIRIADRLIFSVPGEMTVDMGRRIKDSVTKAVAGSGIKHVILSGLANEYVDYLTTPEEYDFQSYEGGSTVYGRATSIALKEAITVLAGSLADGNPAPAPYAYDPTNGVVPDGSSFPAGATAATAIKQPTATRRLLHPQFSWQGGPLGYDRPLDRAFVKVQRRNAAHRWRTVDSDLGLRMLWYVDDNGAYTAEWEPPLQARKGKYRFSIHARKYRIRSKPFALRSSSAIVPTAVETGTSRPGVRLAYPKAIAHEDVGDPPGDFTADLTARPAYAKSGTVHYLINGKRSLAKLTRGGVFILKASPGATIEIPRGAARDRFGNRNGTAVSFTAPG